MGWGFNGSGLAPSPYSGSRIPPLPFSRSQGSQGPSIPELPETGIAGVDEGKQQRAICFGATQAPRVLGGEAGRREPWPAGSGGQSEAGEGGQARPLPCRGPPGGFWAGRSVHFLTVRQGRGRQEAGPKQKGRRKGTISTHQRTCQSPDLHLPHLILTAAGDGPCPP